MARFNFGGGPGEWAPPARDRYGRFISRYAAMTDGYGSNSSIVQRLNGFNETAERLKGYPSWGSARQVDSMYNFNMPPVPKFRVAEKWLKAGAGIAGAGFALAGETPNYYGEDRTGWWRTGYFAPVVAEGLGGWTSKQKAFSQSPMVSQVATPYGPVDYSPFYRQSVGKQRIVQYGPTNGFPTNGVYPLDKVDGGFKGGLRGAWGSVRSGNALAGLAIGQSAYDYSQWQSGQTLFGQAQSRSNLTGAYVGMETFRALAPTASRLGLPGLLGAVGISSLAGIGGSSFTNTFISPAERLSAARNAQISSIGLQSNKFYEGFGARGYASDVSLGGVARAMAAISQGISTGGDFVLGASNPFLVAARGLDPTGTVDKWVINGSQNAFHDQLRSNIGVGTGLSKDEAVKMAYAQFFRNQDNPNFNASQDIGRVLKTRDILRQQIYYEGKEMGLSNAQINAQKLAFDNMNNQFAGGMARYDIAQRNQQIGGIWTEKMAQVYEAYDSRKLPVYAGVNPALKGNPIAEGLNWVVQNTWNPLAKWQNERIGSQSVQVNQARQKLVGIAAKGPMNMADNFLNAIGLGNLTGKALFLPNSKTISMPGNLFALQKQIKNSNLLLQAATRQTPLQRAAAAGGGGGYSAYQRQAQAHYAQMQARQAMFTRLQGYEADAGLEASRVVRAPQMPMRFDYHDMMGGLGSFDYDPKGYFDRLDSGYSRNLAGIKTQYDFNVSGARQEALETKMPYLKELSRIKSDKNYNSSPEMKNAAKGVQEKINSIESYLSHKVKSWDLQLSEVKKDIGMTRENDYFNKAQQIASQFKQGVFNEKIQSIRDKKDFANRRIGDLNFKLQNGMYKSGLFAAESGIREGLSMRGQAAEYDYQESLAYIQREEDQLSQMRFAAYDPRIPEGQRKEILEQMNQMAPALKERRASAERMLKYEQGQATLSRSEVINLRAPIFQQLSSPYVKALMGGLQGKPVMPAVSNAFFGQMTQLANYGAGRWLAGMSEKFMPNGFQGLGLTSGMGVAAKEGTIASMLQHVAGGKFAYLGTQTGFMAGAGGMAAGMIGSQMLYPMMNENYNRSTGFMGSALGGIAGAAIGTMIAPGIGTVAGGAFLGSMAGGSFGLLGAGSGKFDGSIESRYYTRQPVSRMQRAMKSGAGGALTGALVGGIAAGLMTGGLGFFAGAAIGTVGGGLAGGGIGALFGGSSGKMGPLGRAAYQQNELLPFLQSTQMGIDPFSSGFKFSILSDRFLQAARGMQGHGSNGMAMKRAAMTNILGLMNSLQPFQANLEAPGGYKGLLFGASLQDQVMLSGQNPFTSDPFSQMFGFYRDMQSKLGEFGSDNGRLDLAKQAFSGYYGNMMTQLDRSISDGQRDLGFMQRGNSISALDRVLNLDIMNRNVSTFDRDTQIQIEGAMGTLQRRGNIPAIIQKLKDDRAFEKDVLLRKQDILQQSSSLEADQQGANYSDASRTIQEMLGSRDLLTQKFNELLPEIGSTTDLFVKLNQEIRTITESMERFNSAIR
jgi:hypothetical protein